MKVLLVFASLLYTINVFSQTKNPNKNGNLYKNPVYYLDSISVIF
mgnify:CR=1